MSKKKCKSLQSFADTENILNLKSNHPNYSKPPLPVNIKRKRKAFSVLSTISSIAASQFSRKKKKVENMGSVCMKGVSLTSECHPSLSPRKHHKSRISPAPDTGVLDSTKKIPSTDFIFKSDSSEPITHFSDEFESNQQFDNVESFSEVFEEEAEYVEKIKSTKLNGFDADIYIGEENVLGNQKENINLSKMKGALPIGGSPKQISLPNLRRNGNVMNYSKRFSQGDALKMSFGCANLMDAKNSFVEKRNRGENQRHTSLIENQLSIEKRRKRLPTLENGVHVLEAGQVNYYQILEEIGRGSFGAVYKSQSYKDNCYYAMKLISKKRLMRKNKQLTRKPGSKSNPLEPLYREVAILKKVDHPYIVKLVEVIDDIQVDNFYMIFELMTNGVVINIPTDNVISEDRCRRLFQELVLGIEYLHYSKIIHRDIKPSNLLLDENDHLKIADFGVSNMFEGEDDLLTKYAGSPAFQSPEVLDYDSRDKYSGKAVDVWAMGVTLYCFLYGKCPFFSNNFGELSNMIRNDPVKFPDTPLLNPEVHDLMSRMLSKETKGRISVPEIKEHPWVTEGGKTPLPSTEDNCTVIEVTDEEVKNSIKIISKLSSIVLAKSVLKGKSFLKCMPTKSV